MKIMLDPGHYGKYNQSPANKAYYESEAMWKLGAFLKAALESYGVTVGMTRTDPAVDREVFARGQAAKGYDLFISLHSNAVGSGVNEATDYPLVIVPLNKKGDAIGNKLAALVEKTMNTKQKGRIITKEGSGGADYYGVIRGAVSVGVVGVLIEHSFHTQTAATNWLLSDTNLKTMAAAEAACIAEHYGLGAATPATPAQPPATGKTQADIFKGMASADAAARILELVRPNAAATGIFPSVKAAQMILESGYGTSELAQAANNFFGMKTSLSGNSWAGSAWDGTSKYSKVTAEQKPDGTPYNVTADFRLYLCIEDSIADHSAYLLGAKNGAALRYAGITAAPDYRAQIQLIKDGGYATDVSYVQKVCDLIAKFGLDKYDKPGTAAPPAPAPTPSAPLTYKVGDIVQFTGGGVYVSSGAAVPAHSRGKSRCKVTQTYNGNHPYHLISEDGGGVYGWVDAVDVSPDTGAAAPAKKSNEDIAREVIAGKWGNGQERKDRLTAAGYDYNAVQAVVNKLVK